MYLIHPGLLCATAVKTEDRVGSGDLGPVKIMF